MRSELLLSGALHALIVVLLFFVRPVSTISISGPDAVQVALVDAASLPVERAAPTPPTQAPPPPEADAVRIERTPREKPREKKPETPVRTPEPPPRETPPSTTPPSDARPAALPYASTGVPGLSAQVGVDQSDFAFAYYLSQVRQLISAQWASPAGIPAGTRVVIRFRISRDGSVRDPRVSEASGNAWFDQSALRAVTITRRLPPLPAGFQAGELGVHFGFEYTGN